MSISLSGKDCRIDLNVVRKWGEVKRGTVYSGKIYNI